MIKFSRTKKTANLNQIIFFSGGKNINQNQNTNIRNSRYPCSDPKNVPIVLHTQDWLKACSLVDHLHGQRKCCLPAQLTRMQPFISLHMEIVKIEVNEHPLDTLASLKAKILDIMANSDREVIISPLQEVLVSD